MKTIFDEIEFDDPVYKLNWLLGRTRDAIQKVRVKELAQYGLSTAQAALLFILNASDEPLISAKLARFFVREAHSVSSILKRMEAKGLVTRTKDLSKKNLVRISLTDEGEKAYSLSSRRRAYHKLYSKLTDEQKEQLASILRTLLDEAIKEIKTPSITD